MKVVEVNAVIEEIVLVTFMAVRIKIVVLVAAAKVKTVEEKPTLIHKRGSY